jgi:uncharacterized protein
MSHTLTFRVTGMTCHACERYLQETLSTLPGVSRVEANVKTSRVTIHVRQQAKPPATEVLNKLVQDRGYVLVPESAQTLVCETPHRGSRRERAWRALWAFFAVAAIFWIAQPLRAVIPSASSGASIGAMIAFGAVASVSTCLASTGGFLLAVRAVATSRYQQLLIHTGRVAAFVVGGALLGMAGGSLPSVSEQAYGVVALLLGAGFVIVGLHLLDLAPSPAQLGITLPKAFWSWGDRIAHSRGRAMPLAAGAVTFVLPCGFTQTAQALALASGSAVTGALMMGAFALGTLPVLAGISFSGTGQHRPRWSAHFRLVSGAALVLFAIGQLDGGLTVLGAPMTPGTILASFKASSTPVGVPFMDQREQVIRMTVAYGTYQPKQLTVRKGVPVRWEIDGKDIAGCASSIVVPSYGIKKNLVSGLNVVRFTPTKAGVIPFSCGMGMIRGSFTVTE